jgi:hypothetical protein
MHGRTSAARPSPETEKIELALADVAIRVRELDATRSEHGHLDRRFDRDRARHHGLRHVRNVRARVIDAPGLIRVGAGRDRIRAARLGEPRHGHGVLDADALGLAELARVDLHPQRIFAAERRADAAEGVEQHARAILERAAVLVRALVGERREERGEDVAMATVQLHTVDAGFARARGGGDEQAYQFGCIVLRHDPELDLAVLEEIGDGKLGLEEAVDHVAGLAFGYRRRPHRASFLHVGGRDQAAEMQLQRDLCAVRVHRIGERLDAADVPVLGQRELALQRGADRPRDRHRADRDQSRAALGALGVIGARALAAYTARIGEVRAHRRHVNAVLELEAAETPGLEQVRVARQGDYQLRSNSSMINGSPGRSR